MGSRRSAVALALLVLSVAAAAVGGLGRDAPRPGGDGSTAPEPAEAPAPLASPALAGHEFGGTRAVAPANSVPAPAVPATPPRPPQAGVLDLEPGGALDVTLERQTPEPEGLPPPVTLCDRWDRTWLIRWAGQPFLPTVDAPTGAGPCRVEALGADPAARASFRVTGLARGRYLVRGGDPTVTLERAWQPESVDLGAGAQSVVLRAAPAGATRTLRLKTVSGGEVLPWSYVVRGDAGLLWTGGLPADPEGAPVVVPARETLSVALVPLGRFPSVDLPPAQRVVPSADDPTTIVFEVPRFRTVRIRAKDAGPAKPPSGSTFLWRLNPAPDYVDYVTGDLGEGHEYRLPPGAYFVLLAAEGLRAPRTFPFTVEAGEGTLDVDLPLPGETIGWRLKLLASDGSPIESGYVSLVQMDGTDAAPAAWTVGRTDAEGTLVLPALLPGTYRAFWGNWTRSVGLASSGPEVELRLPEVDPYVEFARVRGVVLEPDGQPMRGGYVYVHDGRSPWGRFSGISSGRFDVSDVPPGRVVFEIPDTRLWRTQAPGSSIPLDLRAGETRDLVLRPTR